MPTALITGVSGQDGTYLAEVLRAHDYRVIGTTRSARQALSGPHAAALAGVDLREVRVEDAAFGDLLRRERPDEIYHLAGPSRVATSFSDPDGTRTGIVLPTAALVSLVVEALPSPRLFFASSAEVLAPEDGPQDESSPRAPTSPYGQAKLEAMDIVQFAREKFGVYAVSGILFNHESPRREEHFVSQKIVRGAVRVAKGLDQVLRLGSLDVRRDWAFAGDAARAMWLMMFQETPEDLVIGTGVAHSVADFCEVAFRRVGLDWRAHVVSDPALVRPGDAPLRLANPARAKARLGWTPEVDFESLVAMMVDEQLRVVS